MRCLLLVALVIRLGSGQGSFREWALEADLPKPIPRSDCVRGCGGNVAEIEHFSLKYLDLYRSQSLGQNVRHKNRAHKTQRSKRISRTSDRNHLPWPVKKEAIVEGDLILGGLMMIHEREDSITCGPVMPQGGIQALEAMLYTLDEVNRNDTIPGVKLGAHVLDDCDKDTYGLEMAVDFIKGKYSLCVLETFALPW